MRVWVAGGDAVGEVELGWVKRTGQVISADDLMNGNTHEGVVLRGRAVVEVLCPTGRHGDRRRGQGDEGESHDSDQEKRGGKAGGGDAEEEQEDEKDRWVKRASIVTFLILHGYCFSRPHMSYTHRIKEWNRV